ncbi:protein MAK16 homolog [Eucalyptus grandis]|uniref:protein MAK16 homolog n=1 Tax=Eucalyptus grandis TaxID=71139 RepID=UPI00192EF144|nr:protein MAK16 homolog [Eucalyptus grandis]
MYWPKFLVHKTKQRLTKMTQMRIRMRKLALKTREKIMTTPRKEKKREARREEKAEKAAVLEKSIEKELLERLRKGVYGDIYNYPVKEYEKVLEMDSLQAANEDEEEEPEIEYVEGYDELEEELEDDIEDFGGLAINRVHATGDNGEDEDGDEDEDDDAEADRKRGRKESSLALRKVEKGDAGSKPKKRAKVLVEMWFSILSFDGEGERVGGRGSSLALMMGLVADGLSMKMQMKDKLRFIEGLLQAVMFLSGLVTQMGAAVSASSVACFPE